MGYRFQLQPRKTTNFGRRIALSLLETCQHREKSHSVDVGNPIEQRWRIGNARLANNMNKQAARQMRCLAIAK